MSRAAFCSAALIYLEGIVALVLLTEEAMSPAVLVPLALLLIGQFRLVREPVRLLVERRLASSYRNFFLLAACVVVLLWVASGAVGGILAMLVVAVTSWPIVRAMRMAPTLTSQLPRANRADVVLRCLTFDPRRVLAGKLRAFGGDRVRWGTPWLVAVLTLAAVAIALSLLLQIFGWRVPGAGIAQASTLVAIWAFYRAVRHSKLRASDLRARDTRSPVLILREFGDDFLSMQRFRPGPSFEHLFAGELDRIGPTISVGRPGERLPPLGASRDYLGSLDWKQAVGTLIADAGTVVFVLGDSESLLWEFRTMASTRGRHGTLVIVPPFRNRQELERRWQHFVHEAADLLGADFPRRLPDAPVVVFFFSGDDAILLTGCQRDALNYRLAVRLFDAIRGAKLKSAQEVEAFMRTYLPLAPSIGQFVSS
jgi:hypothetical protein